VPDKANQKARKARQAGVLLEEFERSLHPANRIKIESFPLTLKNKISRQWRDNMRLNYWFVHTSTSYATFARLNRDDQEQLKLRATKFEEEEVIRIAAISIWRRPAQTS